MNINNNISSSCSSSSSGSCNSNSGKTGSEGRMIYPCEDREFIEREFIRMGFNKEARWRISDINKDFKLCETYPRFLIMPSNFKDEYLDSVAKYRYFRRIPTAVWRHIKNGCFIVRSSQPTVGWFGWFRNEMDENLVQSYVNNTMPNSESSSIVNSDEQINNDYAVKNDDLFDQLKEVDKINNDTEVTPQNTPLCNSPNQQQQPVTKELDQSSNSSCRDNHNNNLKDEMKTPADGDGKTFIMEPFPNSESALDDSISNQTPVTTTALSTNTTNGNGSSSADDNLSPSTTVNHDSVPVAPPSKMLIIDARSYTAAMANRAKGGGCECSEYYDRCEVQFMNLANIHSIRKSFHAIRSVCEAYSEQSNNWVSFLDNSRWLHHISGLLKSALLIADTIDIEGKSILIHCSDGWDRTPQLVALAEIMLDSHYRTFDGFRTLIQREWLDFGHKFADRCGSNPCNEDPNERCPVFLQWLDCVQQLMMQFPKHFEFNSSYLDKLNRHTYSNIFGTFSHNSTQERYNSKLHDKVLSLWSYFDSSRRRYRNDNYVESSDILRPAYKIRELHFWKEVYLPPLRNQASFVPDNIDNKMFYDSMYIDGLSRTTCK